MTGPRIFGIPARDAPVVAVLRRGPSEWTHTGRWDYERDTYEPGSWLHGVVYPQRCDLSPNGRWLSYFTLKKYADWPASNAYVALSRLPWLTALAAWGVGNTWTRGAHFVDDRSVWEWGDPDIGDAEPCRGSYGFAYVRPASFAVERRRGWTETADTPPATDADPWDERRDVTMQKPSPDGRRLLLVNGRYAAHRSMEPERSGRPIYALDDGGGHNVLDDVWWADWSGAGDLLTATDGGCIQRRSPDAVTVHWEHDLSTMTPDPQPPPPDAMRW